MSITKEEAMQQIDKKSRLLCELSDTIWEHPETAFQEYISAQTLCDALRREGFSITTGLAGIDTAFSASYGHGRPVIGLLAEFDALSGLSQKDGVTAKEPLIEGAAGHGCGHNLLGVGAMAAALGVKAYLEENKKDGTVILFGCPGEEGGSGKAFMVRDGVFDDVDCALTWHPGDFNVTSVGSSLANYQIIYRFYGVSSHAAVSPHMGRSALDAAELMNVGVQFLREHIVQEARIHYAMTNTGGYSPNVVQSYAELLYLIRAPKTPQVHDIYERVSNIAKGAALMTDTRVEQQFVKACSNIIPNKTLYRIMQKNLESIRPPQFDAADRAFAQKIFDSYENAGEGLDPFVNRYYREEDRKLLREHSADSLYDFVLPLMDTEETMTASSDVGDISWVCPTAQICTTTMAAGTPGHSWQLVSQGKSPLAHKGMLYAGKVMAASAIDLLEDPQAIAAAKAELFDRLGGKSYMATIPKDVKPMELTPKK